MVANKWNDPLFLPITSLKPDTHSDFSLPIALSYESVNKLQPASVEKVEEKWNSMILALKRGIQNWERSGQGDGGFTEEDEIGGEEEEEERENNSNDGTDDMDDLDDSNSVQFGSLKHRPRRALDLLETSSMEGQLTSCICGTCLKNMTCCSHRYNNCMLELDPVMGGLESLQS